MYQPWVGHYFPAWLPGTMADLRWSTYIAMWDTVKDRG